MSRVREFEAKAFEIEWERILKVDPKFYRTESASEEDIGELIEDLVPHFLQCFISKRSPEADDPEKLIQLFLVIQLMLELVNQDFEEADEEVNSLKSVLEETKANLKAAEKQMKHIKDSCEKQFRSDLKKLQKENKVLEDEKQAAAQSNQRLVSERDGLHEKLQKATEELRESQFEVERLKKENNEMNIELRKLRQSSAKQNADANTRGDELEVCRNREHAYLAELSALSTKNAQLDAELALSKRQLEDFTSQLATTSQDLQQNLDQIRELERQRDELGEHCQQLATALASAEEELAEREKQALKSAEEAMRLAQEIEAEKNAIIQQEITEKRACWAEIDGLNQQVKKLSDANAKFSAQIKKLSPFERAVAEKEMTIETLQHRLQELEKLHGISTPRASASAETPRGDHGLKRNEVYNDLLKDFTKEKTRVGELERKMADLEKQLLHKENEYAKIRTKLCDFERGVDGLAEANRQIEDLQMQLDFRDHELDDMKHRVNRAEAAMDAQLNWIEALKALALGRGITAQELDALEPKEARASEMQTMRVEVLQLKDEVQTLEKERLQLKRQLRLQALPRAQRAETLGLTPEQLNWLEDYSDLLKCGLAYPPSRFKKGNETSPKSTQTDSTLLLHAMSTDSTTKPDEVQMLRMELERTTEALRQSQNEIKSTSQRNSDLMQLLSQNLKDAMHDVMGATFAHSVTYQFPFQAKVMSADGKQVIASSSGVGTPQAHMVEQQSVKTQVEASDQGPMPLMPTEGGGQRNQFTAMILRLIGALDNIAQPSSHETNHKLEEIRATNTAITQALDSLRSDLTTNVGQRQKLEDERDQLKVERDRLQQAIDHDKQVWLELEERAGRAALEQDAQVSLAEERVIVLNSLLLWGSKQQRDRSSSNAEVFKKDDQIRTLERTVDQLASELKRTRDELSIIQRRGSGIGSVVGADGATLPTTTASTQRLQNLVAELRGMVGEQQQQQHPTGSTSVHVAKIDELRKEIAQSIASEETFARLSAMENANLSLTQALEKARSELSTCTEARRVAEDRVLRLESERNTYQSRVNELSGMMATPSLALRTGLRMDSPLIALSPVALTAELLQKEEQIKQLHQTNDRLNTRLKEAQDEITRRRAEATETTQRMQAQLLELRATMSGQQNVLFSHGMVSPLVKIDELRQELTGSASDEANKRLQAIQSTNATIARALDHICAELSESVKARDALEERVVRLEADRDAQRANADELSASLAKGLEVRQALEERIAKAELERDEVKAKLEEHSRSAQQKEEQFKDALRKVDELTIRLKTTQEALPYGALDGVASGSGSLQRLQALLAELHSSMDNQATSIIHPSLGPSHLLKTVEDLRRELVTHQVTNKTLQSQLEEMTHAHDDARAEAQRKDEIICRFREDLSAERERSLGAVEKIRQNEAQRQQQMSKAAQHSIATLQKLVEMKEAALIRAQDMLHQGMQKYVAEKQLDNARIQALHDKLFRENNQMIDAFRLRFQKIENMRMVEPVPQPETHENEIIVLKEEIIRLNQVVESQNKELVSLRVGKVDLLASIEHLKQTQPQGGVAMFLSGSSEGPQAARHEPSPDTAPQIPPMPQPDGWAEVKSLVHQLSEKEQQGNRFQRSAFTVDRFCEKLAAQASELFSREEVFRQWYHSICQHLSGAYRGLSTVRGQLLQSTELNEQRLVEIRNLRRQLDEKDEKFALDLRRSVDVHAKESEEEKRLMEKITRISEQMVQMQTRMKQMEEIEQQRKVREQELVQENARLTSELKKYEAEIQKLGDGTGLLLGRRRSDTGGASGSVPEDHRSLAYLASHRTQTAGQEDLDTKDLVGMKQKLQAVENELHKTQLQNAQLKADTDEMEKYTKDLEAKIDALSAANSEWEARDTLLKGELKRLDIDTEGKSAALQKEVDRIQKFREKADEKRKKETADVLAERETRIRTLARDLKAANESFAKERDELKATIASQKKEIDVLKVRIEDVIVQQKKENERLYAKRQELDEEARKMREERERKIQAAKEKKDKELKAKEEKLLEMVKPVPSSRPEKETPTKETQPKSPEEEAKATEKRQMLEEKERNRVQILTKDVEKLKHRNQNLTAKFAEKEKLAIDLQTEMGQVKEKLLSQEKALQKAMLREAELTVPKDQRPTLQSVKQYKLTIIRLEEENDSLRRVLQVDKEIELNNLRASLQRHSQTIRELEDANAKLKRRLDGDEEHLVSTHEQEIENLKSAAHSLEDKLLAEQSLVHEFRFERENLALQVTRLQRHLNDVLQQIKESHPADLALRDPNTSWVHDAGQSSTSPNVSHLKEKEKERDLVAVIDRLKDVISKQQHEIEGLKQKAISNVKYVDCLKELKVLKAKYKETRSELEKSRAGASTIDDAASARTSKLSEENISLNKQLKREREQLLQCRRTISELQSQHEKAVQDYTNLMLAVQPTGVGLRASATSLENLSPTDRALALASEDQKKFMLGTKELRQQILALNTENRALRNDVDEHRKTIESLQQQLNGGKDGGIVDVAHSKATTLELQLNDRTTELGRLKEALQREQAQRTVLSAEIEKLQASNKVLVTENERLKKELLHFDEEFMAEVSGLKRRAEQLQQRNQHLERRNAELESQMFKFVSRPEARDERSSIVTSSTTSLESTDSPAPRPPQSSALPTSLLAPRVTGFPAGATTSSLSGLPPPPAPIRTAMPPLTASRLDALASLHRVGARPSVSGAGPSAALLTSSIDSLISSMTSSSASSSASTSTSDAGSPTQLPNLRDSMVQSSIDRTSLHD